MDIDPRTLDPKTAYKLLIGSVVPRPIAWVSTVDREGRRNLAPFSFFTVACYNPPMVVIAVGQREGEPKDTYSNVVATHEFVVNIVDEANAEAMHLTSAEVDASFDEFDLAGLPSRPAVTVRAPIVSDAPISFECTLEQIVELGDVPFRQALIIGRITWFHVNDGLYREGRIDPLVLRPVGRLAGRAYCRVDSLFEIGEGPRPGPANRLMDI